MSMKNLAHSKTRSSATTEGLRDTLCKLKSCQLQ